MKKLAIIFGLVLFSTYLFAQNGVIKGTVLDENKDPLPNAHVYVEYGGAKIGTTTDFDGNYTIKPLNSGTYNITITCLGYNNFNYKGVVVNSDKITFAKDVEMNNDPELLGEVIVKVYRDPLIKPEDPSRATILPATIEKLPDNKNIASVLRSTSSEIQIDEGSNQPIIRGSRPGESMCIIDGVKQRDFSNTLPGGSIGRMTIYTGGVPAKYGDITGGVVIIESKSYFELLNEYNSR